MSGAMVRQKSCRRPQKKSARRCSPASGSLLNFRRGPLSGCARRDVFQVRSTAMSLAARSVNENGVVVICVAGREYPGKIYDYWLSSVVEYAVHTARGFREGTASGIYVERCPAPFIFGEGSADDYAPNRPRVEMPGKGFCRGEGDLKHRDDLAV